MARPKERPSLRFGAPKPSKMSQAFETKSQQEEEKLQLKVATGLKDDLMSLFDQELHTDVIVTNGTCQVKAHRCILQARAKHLWQDVIRSPVSSVDGTQLDSICIKGMTEKEIRDFLRQLYCVTDTELLLQEFLPHLDQSSHSTKESDLEQDPTSLDVKDGTVVEGRQPSKGNLSNAQEDVPSTMEDVLNSHDDVSNSLGDVLDIRECVSTINGDLSNSTGDVSDSILNVSNTLGDVFGDKVESHDQCSTDLVVDSVNANDRDNLTSAVHDGEPSDCVLGSHLCEGHQPLPHDEPKSSDHELKSRNNEHNSRSHEFNSSNHECESRIQSCDHSSSQDPHPVLHRETDSSPKSPLGEGPTETLPTTNTGVGPTQQSPSSLPSHSDTNGNVQNTTSALLSDLDGDDREMGENNACVPANDSLLLPHDSESSDTFQNVTNALPPEAREDEGETNASGMAEEDAKCHQDNQDNQLSDPAQKASNATRSDVVVVDVEEDVKTNASLTAEEERNCSQINQLSSDVPHTDVHVVDIHKPCSLLGGDLLGLYRGGLHCDCCLSVEGVEFLAHKCILSARSPYFNAMFGGQWSESELEVIHLEGVSADAVEKVLLFFYGGVMDLVSSSDIVELFVVADMYGVESMKLLLQFSVKKDMCHFFHKPCTSCIAKTPEALCLCYNFHLEELQERLLKWMSKNFTKIWCTKAFALVPECLHQLCATSVVSQMTETNVLDVIMECDKLTTSLPRIKWTESILCLTTQLTDLAIEYTSMNFIKVIRAPNFLVWAKIAAWKASALEEIFNSVIDSLPVDTAIDVYQTLLELKTCETVSEAPDQNVLDLLDTMTKRCERFLRTHISLVTRSKQWSSINKTFQSQILENSSYFHLDHFPDPKPRWRKPVVTTTSHKQKVTYHASSTSSSLSSSSSQSSARRQRQSQGQSSTGPKASGERASRNSNNQDGGKTQVRSTVNRSAVNSSGAGASDKQQKNLGSVAKSNAKPVNKTSNSNKHQPEGFSEKGKKDLASSSRGGNVPQAVSTSRQPHHPAVTTLKTKPKPSSSGVVSSSRGKSPSRIPLKTVASNTKETSSPHPQRYLHCVCDERNAEDEAEGSCEALSNVTSDGLSATASTESTMIPESQACTKEDDESGNHEINDTKKTLWQTEHNDTSSHSETCNSQDETGNNLSETENDRIPGVCNLQEEKDNCVHETDSDSVRNPVVCNLQDDKDESDYGTVGNQEACISQDTQLGDIDLVSNPCPISLTCEAGDSRNSVVSEFHLSEDNNEVLPINSSGFASDRSESESHDEVSVVRSQPNLVSIVQPLRVSFVVPDDEQDNPP